MPLRDVIGWLGWKKKIRLPRGLQITIAVVCICIAQFLAYRNQTLKLVRIIEDKRQLSSRVESLESDLVADKEDKFVPARHFTAEQKRLLYLDLRDVAREIPKAHKSIFIGSIRGDAEGRAVHPVLYLPCLCKRGVDNSRPIRPTHAQKGYGHCLSRNA